jgi:ornithine carbamoyltransferase
VPVWNGLTDEWHPTQALADLMTVQEHFGRLKGLKVAYVGDGRNNVANSLMIGCAKAGVHFVNCTPRELSPPGRPGGAARRPPPTATAPDHGDGRPAGGGPGRERRSTPTCGSRWARRRRRRADAPAAPYQVNMAMMKATGNLENGARLIFLHCLPALPRPKTDVTRRPARMEVTDEVFEAPFSKVFDEAENRMHTHQGAPGGGAVAAPGAVGGSGNERLV